MRDFYQVITSVINLIPTNDSITDQLSSELLELRKKCEYTSPEVVIDSGYWNELHSILMKYKSMYHTKMWYVQILSKFTTRSYDEIISQLAQEYN